MISVIIPYFKDAAPYIEETVKSVLLQECRERVEIIISEDGPDSPVPSGIQATVIAYPVWTGVYPTLNRGILASSGDLIAILAADDLLTRDSLEKRRLEMGEGVVLVCGQAISIGANTTLETAERKVRTSPNPLKQFYGPTIMLQRSVLDRAGLFNEELKWRGDKEMWARLFGPLYDKTRYGYYIVLPDFLGFRRMRLDSQQHQFCRLPRSERQAAQAAFKAVVEAHTPKGEV